MSSYCVCFFLFCLDRIISDYIIFFGVVDLAIFCGFIGGCGALVKL